MLTNHDDEDRVTLGIRRKSDDKLTYKQILANVINQYLKTFGSERSEIAVSKIKQATSFNIPGYEFGKRYKEIEQKLQHELMERERQTRKKLGRKFHFRAEKAKFKISQKKWYWDAYFQKQLQMLAEHGIVIEADNVIKIRSKQKVLDDMDDEYSERQSDRLYE